VYLFTERIMWISVTEFKLIGWQIFPLLSIHCASVRMVQLTFSSWQRFAHFRPIPARYSHYRSRLDGRVNIIIILIKMKKLYLLIEENSYCDIESSLEDWDFVCKTWNFQIHIFPDFNLRNGLEISRKIYNNYWISGRQELLWQMF